MQCGVQTIGRRNELTQAIEQSRARRADRRIRDANSETASPPRFDRCLTLDDFFLMSIFHPTLTHALRIESDLAVGHRPPLPGFARSPTTLQFLETAFQRDAGRQLETQEMRVIGKSAAGTLNDGVCWK